MRAAKSKIPQKYRELNVWSAIGKIMFVLRAGEDHAARSVKQNHGLNLLSCVK
jgi:hypothetical protein